MQGIHFLVEKHCEICDKLFYPTGMWVYKIKEPLERTRYYCSWTCFQKGKERYRLEKRKDRKRKEFNWRYGDK